MSGRIGIGFQSLEDFYQFSQHYLAMVRIHVRLGPEVEHRNNAYLNRRIEQDHRGIKQRYYPMLGFGAFPSAKRFCRAFEEVRQYFRPRRKRKQFVSLPRGRQQFLKKVRVLQTLFAAA